MIYLGFLLHLYQPPQQVSEVMRTICNESYRPLMRLINMRSDARFTMNINWSLTERWLRDGYSDLVDAVRVALESDRIEITSSAAYHAIVPLIPRSERARQVLLNDDRSRGVYGKSYHPVGFFPPEMAFGPEVVDTLKPLGYKWTITDDAPFSALHGSVPGTWIPAVEGFPVVLRSGMWSNRVSMERNERGEMRGGAEMAHWLIDGMSDWFGEEDGYCVIAMDGETFGHHHKGYIEKFLVPFLDTLSSRSDEIRLVHVKEIVEKFPHKAAGVPPGSWSTSREEFLRGDFYPLWKGHRNEAHDLLWELTTLAHSGVDRLHQMLDQGLNSCTFWWVGRNPGEFNPMTLGGIKMLMQLIRLGNPEAVEKAEAIHSQLVGILGPPPPLPSGGNGPPGSPPRPRESPGAKVPARKKGV